MPLTDAPHTLPNTLLTAIPSQAHLTLPRPVSPVFVDTAAEQTSLDAQLSQALVLGVDTEFIRESTFYPALALVQLAVPQQSEQYLVDVPTLADSRTEVGTEVLAVLKQQLCCANTVKVMHGCSEDIEIFQQFCGDLPKNVFDTQIAAALLGGRAQTGYDGLVAGLFGAQLDKSVTRSDWLKRPLTDKQLFYAAADVAYLLPLYDALREALAAKGRSQWLTEEYEQLAYSLQNPVPASLSYQRIGVHWRLRGRALYVLQQLCLWREKQVRLLNIPRSFLLSDAAIVAVAKSKQHSSAVLRRLPEIKPMQWRRYGKDLVVVLTEILANAPAGAGEDLPVILPKSKKYRPLVKSLKERVAQRASDLGIETNVLLGKRYLQKFLTLVEQQYHQQGSVDITQFSQAPWLQGWRQKVILADLVDPILAWLQAQTGS